MTVKEITERNTDSINNNGSLMFAKSLYMIYRSKAEHASIVALKGVELELKKGEFVSIVGPSGSGKTTLLQIIGGLLHPTGGSVVFEGQDITKTPEEELTRYRREQIGFVFQEGNLLPDLSAYNNVNQSMVYNGLPYEYRKKRTLELLDLMGVLHRKNQRATLLSGGERQRVAVARSMANEPKLIIADEPTGNVDFETSIRLLELFKELNREIGTSFLIATHSTHVASYAYRIVELRDGLMLGQHGGNIDLSQLETSRMMIMDSDNRITVPTNILAQLGISSKLWNFEVVNQAKICLTPLEDTLADDSSDKNKECPVCGEKNLITNRICTSCGTKF